MEDEVAENLATFALALAACRQKRCLWLSVAWPRKMLGILSPVATVVDRALADFKADLRVWELVEAYPSKCVHLQ